MQKLNVMLTPLIPFGEAGVVRFGAGISASQVRLGLGSLMLDLGNGDEVHIANFDRNDVFNSSSIGSFEFEDGTILTTKELLARGFDLDGVIGSERMRWRSHAAIYNFHQAGNDEATQAWRIAA